MVGPVLDLNPSATKMGAELKNPTTATQPNQNDAVSLTPRKSTDRVLTRIQQPGAQPHSVVIHASHARGLIAIDVCLR